MRQIKAIVAVLGRAFNGFIADDIFTLAAALAFYTVLSLAPLILLTLWGLAAIDIQAQQLLLDQLAALIGEDGRAAAQAVIDSANARPQVGSIAGGIGLITLFVGATTVFAQLQSSLNFIWHIPPRQLGAVTLWLRNRLLSIGVIGAIGFVAAVSLLISTALGLFLSHSGPIWDIANEVLSTFVFAVLFAALFRYLPDARLPWRHAWNGGLVTALLFGIGKWLIGFYLARGNVGGAYGAAGSLVVLLVWVYYSGIIFLFGAELVHAWFPLVESGPAVSGEHAASAAPRDRAETIASRRTTGVEETDSK